MTNEQIQRIYNTKMRNIMLKNARREQDQDDADRAAIMKQQADNAKTSQKLALLGMYKDLKDSYDIGMVSATYGDEGDITEAGRPLKFTRKDPRSIGEVITQPKETLKRLLPGGQYEKTEGYKKFQAKEKRGEYIEETFESPEFLAKKEAFKKDALSWEADELKFKKEQRGYQAEYELLEEEKQRAAIELEANRKLTEQQLAVRRKLGHLPKNWLENYESIMGENKQDPYTDEQRKDYMGPQYNIWDSQIENNKNRRPYDLRPPMEY